MHGRFEKLEQLYAMLDREARGFSLACTDKCPDCCTVNVTVTSLEAALIFHRLEAREVRQMLGRLDRGFPERRYVPVATANGFARACMEGRDLPEEENDPHWGACPLLEQGRCTIYRTRPLGCRVMMSQALCRASGFARMPPFALTLANLLGQWTEQLDPEGFTGNFSDVLKAYAVAWPPGGRRESPLYLTLDNIPQFDRKGVFLRNHPIPALMVPPEHREQTAPLIRELRSLGGTGGGPGNGQPIRDQKGQIMTKNVVDQIDDKVKIRTMLVSVSDKTGLEAFVPGMLAANPDLLILSTGGTHARLREILGDKAANSLKQVSDYTGQPETQGGLVKTLDFKIYLGLLTETYNPAHQDDLKRTGALAIDMVVVNLYPFSETIAKAGVTVENARGNIDIGGPTMIRASAKNFIRVASVVDPASYPGILEKVRSQKGCLSLADRYELSRKAFEHTAVYDRTIADYLGAQALSQVQSCYSTGE